MLLKVIFMCFAFDKLALLCPSKHIGTFALCYKLPIHSKVADILTQTSESSSIFCSLKNTWQGRSNPVGHPCFCQRFSSVREEEWSKQHRNNSCHCEPCLSVAVLAAYFSKPPVTPQPTHSAFECESVSSKWKSRSCLRPRVSIDVTQLDSLLL